MGRVARRLALVTAMAAAAVVLVLSSSGGGALLGAQPSWTVPGSAGVTP